MRRPTRSPRLATLCLQGDKAALTKENAARTWSNEATVLSHSTPGREASCERPAASPSEAVGEQELLAGLLAYSRSAASAPLLLQHFPSIGHVLSAEPSQLEAFGLTTADVALSCALSAKRLAAGEAQVRIRPTLGNWQALLDYLERPWPTSRSNTFASCS